MSKFSKLHRDSRPQDQPNGTYQFSKNGIQNYIQNSSFNEPGFNVSEAVIPYGQVISILENDKFPIIFSTNNVNSAIGYFDVENDTYIPVIDDSSLSFKLPFDSTHYITGQVQRNFKGEIVVAFTDKNEVPYYVNMDNPVTGSLNDLRLFPNALPADIKIEVLSGGILLPGAYYAAVKYTKKDGMETNFVAVSAPRIVDGTNAVATDKCLELTITNIDADYDNLQIAIISKINGVLTAVQFVNPIPAIGSATILYTGTELTEPVTLEEILTPRKVYTKVGTMGQLNDALYIANLESPKSIKMQKWANLVRLKWHSKMITVDPVYEPHKSGEEKSHMHGEVYSWYLRYKLSNGTTTAGFTIPGEALVSGDRLPSSTAAAEGITADMFQVEDTISSFDATSKSGYFGKWENASETYPNTADFDSSSIGGRDLRGQKVLHHKFPSLAWCKSNLYSGDPNYGRNSLDMLGVSVENVIIPSEYADIIVGWELFYAKRNVANSTIIGQSLVINGARNKSEPELNPSNYYSSGGNWTADIFYKTVERFPVNLDQSIFHFYSFDMLFNKPSVTPDYLSFELKHKRVNFPYTGGVIEDQAVNSDNDGPIVFNLDYLQKGIPPTIPSKRIKAVKDTQYVPNNIELGKWHNAGIEGFFGGKFTNPEKLIPDGEVYGLLVEPNSRRSFTSLSYMPNSETCFLANMMSVKEQLFVPFTAQSLVREATSTTVNNSTVFYNGDIYICDYTFHTYGLWNTNQDQSDGAFGSMFMGTKVARRFICECVANLYTRYEEPANQYTRFYPKSTMVGSDPNNYLTNFIRTYDPNQFGYKKDNNALDDLFESSIYNTFAEDITTHPYRIHRLGKLSRQTKVRNWRTCLALDYYEAQKNMGKIIHLEGMDDRLIIHHENAMFLTQDKTKLESDIIAVTIGSGDIFQFQPQEAMSAKLGYAGTQHDLACVRTPMGYVFIDSTEGQIFIYKGDLKLLNTDLNTFFREYLRVKEKNTFIGNGYTIGYDPKYKRMLLTAKNQSLADGGNLIQFNPADIGTYTAGMKFIKNGRIVEFLGVNPTEYECPEVLMPSAGNEEFTIPEDTPIGTVLGSMMGDNIVDWYIDGISTPFIMEPSTSRVTLIGLLDYYVQNTYTFTGKAYALNGAYDTFNLVINITEVDKAPTIENAEVTILDNSPNNFSVHTMVATDRAGSPLTFSIVGGNIATAFKINGATGQVQVNDTTKLNALAIPIYVLSIQVSNGTLTAVGFLTINMQHVNKQVIVEDTEFFITDTQSSASIVGTAEPAIDPEGDPITYTLISESHPGVFTINLSTLEVTLVDNASLNPAVTPVYTLYMSATDGNPGHALMYFEITINVEYDRTSLKFIPYNASCTGGTPSCPAGYTLSDDETTCVKVLTETPDIISGGVATNLAHFSDPNYSYWGSLIYPIGTYNSSGVPSVKPNSTLITTFAPIYPYKPGGEASVVNGLWANPTGGAAQDGTNGRLNRTGVWKQADQYFNGVLGFSRQIIVPATGNYLIGVGADDAATIKINGVTIIAQDLAAINASFLTLYTVVGTTADLFRYWHIYEIALNAGPNIISVTSNNTGTLGIIGVEVYDATPAELIAATNEAALAAYVLFSSAAPPFGSIANGDVSDIGYYDCSSHPSYTLVYDPVTLTYYCKKVETDTPSPSSILKEWNNVRVLDKRHSDALIEEFDNQLTPVLTFQDIDVPYYAPVEDHIDCGGSVTTYMSVEKFKNAQKNDCTSGVGTLVKYVIPEGYKMATSQATADAAAQAVADAGAQAYANSKGQCN